MNSTDYTPPATPDTEPLDTGINTPDTSSISAEDAAVPLADPEPHFAPSSMADPEFRLNSLRVAVDRARRIATDVEDTLNRCPMLSESCCGDVRAEVRKLANYEITATRLIGVVGHSGDGKSSLIKSLLDINDLRLTREDGSAITPFPIEYLAKTQEQQAPFTLVATPMTLKEVDEYLGELLEDYRKPFLTNLDRLKSEEHKEMGKLSETARSIFDAAFSHLNDYDLEQLECEKNPKYQGAFRWLEYWVGRLDWPRDIQANEWKTTADTGEECANLLARLVDRGIWPFLKKLKVYLDGRILRDGLVLVDLPNYHDSNPSRARIVREYQGTCHEFFLVSNIKRAMDDSLIKTLLEQHRVATLGSKTVFKPNVVLICTHAADITYKRKLEERVDPARLAAVKAHQAEVDRYCFTGAEARVALRQVDLQYQALLIEARNSIITKNLRKAYSKYYTPEEAPVFCVDNCMHQTSNSPMASKISGIVALQRYCYASMDKGWSEAAEDFLSSYSPKLLDALESWAARCSKPKEDPQFLNIESIAESMQSITSLWKRDATFTWTSAIEKPLLDHTDDITSWNLVNYASWDKKGFGFMRALIIRRGDYYPRGGTFTCWNVELVANLNMYSASGWAELMLSHQNILQSTAQLCAILRDFGSTASKTGAPQVLVRNWNTRAQLLEQSLTRLAERFREQLSYVKNDATSGYEESYVENYMLEGYRECRHLDGTDLLDFTPSKLRKPEPPGNSKRTESLTSGLAPGTDPGVDFEARIRQRLSKHLSSPEFVTKQVTWIKKDVCALIEATAAGLEAEVMSAITAAKEDLDRTPLPPLKTKSLFDRYPAYRKEVEHTLATARTAVNNINDLIRKSTLR